MFIKTFLGVIIMFKLLEGMAEAFYFQHVRDRLSRQHEQDFSWSLLSYRLIITYCFIPLL